MLSRLSYRPFLSFLLVGLLSHGLRGQQYNFRNFSVGDGLSQSQVYTICQGETGELWIGTRGGGIDRFDGIQFSSFTEKNGLSSNFIRCSTTDLQGNLWFGTDHGLCRYNGKVVSSFAEKEGLGNATVNDLCFDKQNRLWVATEKGLFLFSNNHFINISKHYKVAGERVTSLYTDQKGVIWVGAQWCVFGMVPQGDSFQVRRLGKKEGLQDVDVTDITGDENGIWIATYGDGIHYYDGNKAFALTKAQGLPHNSIYCLYYTGNKRLWMGSSAGVSVLDYPTLHQDSIRFDYYTESSGLCNNVIRCLFKDSFGNMWMGSSGGGLSRLDSKRFLHLPPKKDVLGDLVFSILKDEKGTVWLASSEGGVTWFHGKSLRKIGPRQGLTSGKVKCLKKMPDGTIWLGTTGSGVYRYKNGVFQQFTRENGIGSMFVNDITSDRMGRVWFAEASGAVSYFDSLANRFVSLKSNLFGTNRVSTVYVDAQDNIWIGTQDAGLAKIPHFGQKETPVVQRIQMPGSINTSKQIRCIAEEVNGSIVLGTAGKGVWRYDGAFFKELKGLPSDNVYFLHRDRQGLFWIGTDRGVTKCSIGSDSRLSNVHTYTKSSGLLGIETTHNGVFEEEDGKLWFGTISGACRYDPYEDGSSPIPPKLHLSGINLFFDPLENTQYGKNKTPWYPIPSALQLPHDKNSLSFEFLGIQLKEPEAIRYTWKLEGFDKEWSPVTDRKEAVYSNLAPGAYTFQVKAQSGDGIWTPETTSFAFFIQPPFWATWWFRTLLAVLLLGLLWSIYKLRIRSVKKRIETEKKQLETEKTLLELEQKSLHLQMNPHFLFNCLNSIKGLIAEEKSEEAKHYLNRFAKLMRSMLDNSRENDVALSQEIELLHNYVLLEKLSRDNEVVLTIEHPTILHPETIRIPPMLIQPFVENALLHGLASQKRGDVRILFEKGQKHLSCTIEDNGIGREEAEKRKQPLAEEHKSVAIEVIKERLAILLQETNALQIVDLKDKEGKAIGTRVELLLPYSETI